MNAVQIAPVSHPTATEEGMNIVIGDVDRTIAKIGFWTIELSRETPTAGAWHVSMSVFGGSSTRRFTSGPAAAEFFRRQCDAALELKRVGWKPSSASEQPERIAA